MRTKINAILVAVAILAGCGGAHQDQDDTTFTVNTDALSVAGRNLQAVQYSVYTSTPSDLQTFDGVAQGCAFASGSYNTSCLPQAGFVEYALTPSGNPLHDVTYSIGGSATAFKVNISIAPATGLTMAVAGLLDDGSYCYGASAAPFAIVKGMKTTVPIAFKCAIRGSTPGFANINTTTTFAQQVTVYDFANGPLAVTAGGGEASGQVTFTLTAGTDQVAGDFVGVEYNALTSGTWSSTPSGAPDGVKGCHPLGSTDPLTCTLYYRCGATPSTQPITVTVWTSAASTTANPANPPALATPVVLNFGDVVCAN